MSQYLEMRVDGMILPAMNARIHRAELMGKLMFMG